MFKQSLRMINLQVSHHYHLMENGCFMPFARIRQLRYGSKQLMLRPGISL
jgi:hypothetical protein